MGSLPKKQIVYHALRYSPKLLVLLLVLVKKCRSRQWNSGKTNKQKQKTTNNKQNQKTNKQTIKRTHLFGLPGFSGIHQCKIKLIIF